MFIFYTTEFEPKGCPNHYYTIKIPRYNFIKNRETDRQCWDNTFKFFYFYLGKFQHQKASILHSNCKNMCPAKTHKTLQ